MTFDGIVRELRQEEQGAALALAWRVFLEFEAPDYTKQGIDAFDRSIHETAYLAQLRWYGAFEKGTLVGMLATRSEGTHIALFFVDGQHHRQGIGRRLFALAESHAPSGKMTVHSSRYAVPVYHRLGFRDTGDEQSVSGLLFTPMERQRED